jgi:hypothetical protein
MVDTLELTNTAVCTSGDYERRGHIVDARSRGELPRAATHTQSREPTAPTLQMQAQSRDPMQEQHPTPMHSHAQFPTETMTNLESRTTAQEPTTAPARVELASVTVIAPTAMAADGLSTAAMVLGRERGARLLEQQGVRAVLVAPDGSVRQVNP